MTRSELPIVDPPVDADASETRVAGILLAAGTSSRFGDANKLLATLDDGTPVVRASARTLCTATVDPVIVVVGHEADRVVTALDGLDINIVHNAAYATGQASSVRAGIETVATLGVDAALVALGDMPFVAPESVTALVAAHAAGSGDALAAAHAGQRGNPVLFDRRFFDALAAVDGDVGGREILLTSDGAALVAVDDPGVCRDVDVPDDL